MFGLLFKNRVRQPLFVSIQTRDINPVGALSFAFWTPYRTPSPRTGTGVLVGSLRAEQGRQSYQQQTGTLQGLGGLATGVLAMQPLVAKDYVSRNGQ